MDARSVSPSISSTAFSCPHCGAYTTQYWHELHAKRIDDEKKIPFFPKEEDMNDLRTGKNADDDQIKMVAEWMEKILSKNPFLEYTKSGAYVNNRLYNVHLSTCYNCNRISIWLHDGIIYPHIRTGSEPVSDLPEQLKYDYEEARSILALSPRGSAALLRLCIQKLCKELGEKGENINDDIKSLVSKGLSPVIQQSLDIVRVVGNEAVHPGQMDLKDDRETALKLLNLVNVIVEQMITIPKTIKEMYDKLPDEKRKAIDKRDQA